MTQKLISIFVLITFLTSCATVDTNHYEIVKPASVLNVVHKGDLISIPSGNKSEKLCVSKIDGNDIYTDGGGKFKITEIKQLHKYSGNCWDGSSTEAKIFMFAAIVVIAPLIALYAVAMGGGLR